MWEQIKSNRLNSLTLTIASATLVGTLGYLCTVPFRGKVDPMIGILFAEVVWLAVALVSFFLGGPILATMVGIVQWLAMTASRTGMSLLDHAADVAEGTPSSATDEGGIHHPLVSIACGIAAPVLWALAVPAALIIAVAMSRQREYLADASAVLFTRNPVGLASALRKLSGCDVPLRKAAGGAHHLFIVDPTRIAHRLLSTHPPVEDRVARILGTASMDARALPAHGAGASSQPAVASSSTRQFVAAGAVATREAPGPAKCPRCTAPLSPRHIRAKVSSGCRSCGGAWIDAESLMQLVKSSPDTLRRFDSAFRNRVGYGWGRVSRKHCPDCGEALTEDVVHRDPRIAVDSCASCHCTWFDDGELVSFIWACGKGK